MPSNMATKRNASSYLDDMKKVTPSRQTVVDAIAKARAREMNKRTTSPSEIARPVYAVRKKSSTLDPEPSGVAEVDVRHQVKRPVTPTQAIFQNVFASRFEANHQSSVQHHAGKSKSSVLDIDQQSDEERDPIMDDYRKVVNDPPAADWQVNNNERDSAPSQSPVSIDAPDSSDSIGVPEDEQEEDAVAQFLAISGKSEAFQAKKFELEALAEIEECEFGLSARNLPNSPSMKSDIGAYDSWELKCMASEETVKATGNARRTRPHKGTFVRKGKKKGGDQEDKIIRSLFSVDSSVAAVDALFDLDGFDDYDDDDASDEDESSAEDIDIDEDTGESTPAGSQLQPQQEDNSSRHDVVVFDEGEGVEMLETAEIQDEVESALGKDEVKAIAKKEKLQEETKSKPKKVKKGNEMVINIRVNTMSNGLDPAGDIKHSASPPSKATDTTLEPDCHGRVAEAYDDFVQDFIRSESLDGSSAPSEEIKVPESLDESSAHSDEIKITETLTEMDEGEELSVRQSESEITNTSEGSSMGEPEGAKEFFEHFEALTKEKSGKKSIKATKENAPLHRNGEFKPDLFAANKLVWDDAEKTVDARNDSTEDVETDKNKGKEFPFATRQEYDQEAGRTDDFIYSYPTSSSEWPEDEPTVEVDDSSQQSNRSQIPVKAAIGKSAGGIERISNKDSKFSEFQISETVSSHSDGSETNSEGSNPEPIKIFTFEKGMSRKAWSRRKEMATEWKSNQTWLSPRTLNGVSAAKNIGVFANTGKEPELRPWKLSYQERTRNHSGFRDIHVYSIRESTEVVIAEDPVNDAIPWERRDVKQRFLQERSVEFSRNWFGENLRWRGNDKYKPPICKPKSMEMPISNAPDSEQWTEDVYTAWKSPFQKFEQDHLKITRTDDTSDARPHNRKPMVKNGESFSDKGSSYSDGDSSYSESEYSYYSGEESCSSSDYDDDSEASWEEAPECGHIINMRLKIGEHITRVHPDYTSSLRRSRWRKKYFPKGTFPY
eukprot:scaffold22596_cov131-Cylindrotheca_fusiformis.AAC.21